MRGKATSIFSQDVHGRDNLRYAGKKLTDPINTAEDKWRLLPAFLQTKGLVKQHLDSFNYFLHSDIKNIIMANSRIESDVDPSFWLRFTDIRVRPPQGEDLRSRTTYDVTPQDCRLRDMTYAGTILVDIKYMRGKQIIQKRNIEIGKMPIMLRSDFCVLAKKTPEEMTALGECPLDPGGYFIIRGTEKVILIQEQLQKNRIIVEPDRSGFVAANVTSSTHEKKSKTSVVYAKGGKTVLKHNSLNVEIPIVIILKAMGLESDREICELVCGQDSELLDLFAPAVEETTNLKIVTQKQALDFVGSKVRTSQKQSKPGVKLTWAEEARELLHSTVLAHVPVDIDRNGEPMMRGKAVYVCLMVRRVLQAVRDGGITDDRDFVGNKRLELAGQLLSLLFEDLFKSWCSNIKRAIDTQLKRVNRTTQYDAATAVSSTSKFITDGLFRAISSGNWNVKRFKMERAGVTQVLSRLSYVSALGMLTRISSQFEKTRKVSGPRALQTSQWGMLCPSDTPEGEACGLIKNLALMTHITTDSDDGVLKQLCFALGTEDVYVVHGQDLYSTDSYLVFVNGVLLGVHRRAGAFVQTLRSLRRRGKLDPLVSIYKTDSQKTVHLSSDGGRVCRPLIVVEKGVPQFQDADLKDLIHGTKTFEDFVHMGKIEYLDTNEETDCDIAIYEADLSYSDHVDPTDPLYKPNTTHLEIAPFTILGAVAGLIPYPHHNQSPRNTYQCAMGKQAIGSIAYNQYQRIDTLLYLMCYPQHPMVRTKTIEMIGYDKLPAGQNATVAVMSYSGYDIEDALVLNKASLDRGFGRCEVLRKFSTMIKSYPNQTYDRLADPLVDDQGQVVHKYGVLDLDGIAQVKARVASGQVIVNKQTPTETIQRPPGAASITGNMDPSTIPFKNTPLTYKYPGDAIVDQVVMTTNEEDQTMIKVSIRQTRRPELGDKFSSRHGQKGVVGIIVPQEDLPFSEQGVIPDVIMNPHGFPSRMTVGKMIELLSGKAGVLAGEVQYGTVYFTH
jgi:DNA-directed RNA polymerase III subunit RPC2